MPSLGFVMALAALCTTVGSAAQNVYTQDTVGYSSPKVTDPLLQEIWDVVTFQMDSYFQDCDGFGNTFRETDINYDDVNIASDRAGLVKICKLTEHQTLASPYKIHNIVPFWTMNDGNGTLKPIPNLAEYRVAIHLTQAVTFKFPIPALLSHATTMNFTDTILTQTFVRVGKELKSVEWSGYYMYQDPSLPTLQTVTDPLLQEIWDVVTLQMDTYFEDCDAFGSTFAETVDYNDVNIASDRAGLVKVCRLTEHQSTHHPYTIHNIVPFWKMNDDSGILKPVPGLAEYKVAIHLSQSTTFKFSIPGLLSDAHTMNFTDTILTQTFIRDGKGLKSVAWWGYYMYEVPLPSSSMQSASKWDASSRMLRLALVAGGAAATVAFVWQRRRSSLHDDLSSKLLA